MRLLERGIFLSYINFFRVRIKTIFWTVVLALLQNSCGGLYPDKDVFKDFYPGTLDYYYFTNLSYSIEDSVPVMKSSTNLRRLFFMVDQRDDIYYNKGFEVDFKKFDKRWFLQVENVNTNYYFYSNTNFGNNISFHYYELGGTPLAFTNGYLMLTQSSANSWIMDMQLTNLEQQHYAIKGVNRLAVYRNGDFVILK